MSKVAIITGATSSLGTALVDECIEQNIEVVALVNPDSKNIDRITKNDSVHIVECSLDSMKNIEIPYKGDMFFHLGWASTNGDQARNNIGPQVDNIRYALDAVDLAERLGCKVFVGAGSQAEYGRTEEVLTEETECHPETAYGMAKLCTGQMTRLACKNKGIKHIWPRILSAYGPNCQPQTVLNYTITELLNDRKPSLSGGDQIWDFIYTGDVARALISLADKGKDGETYVIGFGQSRKLREYLEEAREIVEKMLGHEVPGLGLGEKDYGPNTVMHLACDVSKIMNDTGYESNTSFNDGIEKTVRWILNN